MGELWAKALITKANDELLMSGVVMPLYCEPTVVREFWMFFQRVSTRRESWAGFSRYNP